MLVCTVCGKVFKEGQVACPNGHRLPANITSYVKELQRTGASITIRTENGLTSTGRIQLVTETGFYLYGATVVEDPVIFSWDEIDRITLAK